MMFINDLIDNMNSNLENVFTNDDLVLFMILYADDAVVFAKSKETLQSLCMTLNFIVEYVVSELILRRQKL